MRITLSGILTSERAVLINAPVWIWLSLFDKVILPRLIQPENAAVLIILTLFGITISKRLWFPKKQFSSIISRFYERPTACSFWQLLNALLSIVLILFGILICVRPELWKQFRPIFSTPYGSSMLCNLEHLNNALSPTVFNTEPSAKLIFSR